jgi:hypothetical protein
MPECGAISLVSQPTLKEISMKRSLGFGVLLAAFCGIVGCGASADSLMNDQVKAMNEMADALEKKAPESTVSEIQTRMKNTNEKLEALKLSDDEKKKLLERHKDELTKATTRVAQASMNKVMEQFGKGFGGGFPGMPDPGKMPGFPGFNNMPVVPGAGGLPVMPVQDKK